MWAVCLKQLDGQVVVFTPDMKNRVAAGDFEKEAHIVPYAVDGNHYSLGAHDITRSCACHPRIENRDGIPFVVHTTRTQ